MATSEASIVSHFTYFYGNIIFLIQTLLIIRASLSFTYYQQILFIIFYFLMKNSLELQISTLIKRANSLYSKNKLEESLDLYEKASQVFHENINYNNFVSEHYGSLIQSLKGQLYMEIGQYLSAQVSFNSTLQKNPFDFLTLIRRSKLFCLTNRPAEALEDAQNAYIIDPEGQTIKQLFKILNAQIEKIEDDEQRKRLQENFNNIKLSNDELTQELDNQEQILSFSNLKQIDRQSFSSKNQRRRNSGFSGFSGFQTQNFTHKQYSQNILKINEQENYQDGNCVVILDKSSKKKKLRNATHKKCLSINLCEQNFVQNKYGEDSVKSIEKKIEKRTSVKFLQNINILNSESNNSHNENDKISQRKQRKSCLRSSKLNIQNFNSSTIGSQIQLNSFGQIKNIDGTYISSCNSNKVSPSQQNVPITQTEGEGQKQFQDSGDQGEQKQHNIYGHKYRTSKILKCIQNIEGWSGKVIQPDGKKRSILKKHSVIGSQRDSGKSKLAEMKNSVHFITQNSQEA